MLLSGNTFGWVLTRERRLVVLGAYATGFSVLMLAATVAIAVGRNALLERVIDRRNLLEQAAGVALVLAGIGQLVITYQIL